MSAPTAAFFLAAGLLAGTLHFALLRWNASLYTQPPRLAWVIGAPALRLVATTALLLFTASHGALSLLLAALGILVARFFVVHHLGRIAP